MWPFPRKSSLEDSGLFEGFTDWHSHILPGVDDGIPDMEQSLQILECFERLGVGALWLTPHIMEDIPNTTSGLQERFGELQSAYKGPIRLHLAAEYMLDNCFDERLKNGDLLCIGNAGSRTVLVETSFFSPPMDLYGTLKRIKMEGYNPLLAHPERYMYMEMDDYEHLASMDVQFQCNITSLAGAYGRDAARKISAFLSNGWVRALGTDVHRLSSFGHEIAVKCIGSRQKALLSAVANMAY